MAEDKTTPTEMEQTQDVEREQLLSAIAGMDAPESVNPDGGEHTPPTEEAKPPEAEAESKPADSEGESTEATAQEDEPESESKYKRAQKNRKRKEKTWAEINAEKAALKAQQEQIAREKEEVERLKAEARQKQAEAGKMTPEQYLEVAKQFEAEGQDDLAETARKEAERLRTETEQAKREQAIAQAKEEWQRNLDEQIEQHPELKDPKAPLYQAVEHLLKVRPVLGTYGSGIKDAVEVAVTHLEAQKAKTLAAEVAKLRKELAERDRKLQPGDGQPAPPQKSVTWDTMSDAEQRALLLRQMQEADRMGMGVATMASQRR